MNNIADYKNKDVGILGTGLSGLAAAKVLLNSKANVFAFDDKKSSLLVEENKTLQPDFWEDSSKAQVILKKVKSFTTSINDIDKLIERLSD